MKSTRVPIKIFSGRIERIPHAFSMDEESKSSKTATHGRFSKAADDPGRAHAKRAVRTFPLIIESRLRKFRFAFTAHPTRRRASIQIVIRQSKIMNSLCYMMRRQSPAGIAVSWDGCTLGQVYPRGNRIRKCGCYLRLTMCGLRFIDHVRVAQFFFES